MAVLLSRSVRFTVPFGDPGPHEREPRHNTFAGWPPMHGLGAHYEVTVTCRGEPDPRTGYVMNIAEIDQAVRSHALPIIEQAARNGGSAGILAHALATIQTALQVELHERIHAIQWRLSPYHALAMHSDSSDRASLSQQFEFSASHRLHVDDLSDEDNRRVFGKCNNPNGHGHNYRLEVTVSVPLGSKTSEFSVATLDRIVNQTVLQRLDHKHLNLDVAEFAKINPSVENITKHCYALLEHPLREAGAPLEKVTVWETEKTSCTYPA